MKHLFAALVVALTAAFALPMTASAASVHPDTDTSMGNASTTSTDNSSIAPDTSRPIDRAAVKPDTAMDNAMSTPAPTPAPVKKHTMTSKKSTTSTKKTSTTSTKSTAMKMHKAVTATPTATK